MSICGQIETLKFNIFTENSYFYLAGQLLKSERQLEGTVSPGNQQGDRGKTSITGESRFPKFEPEIL